MLETAEDCNFQCKLRYLVRVTQTKTLRNEKWFLSEKHLVQTITDPWLISWDLFYSMYFTVPPPLP